MSNTIYRVQMPVKRPMSGYNNFVISYRSYDGVRAEVELVLKHPQPERVFKKILKLLKVHQR